jgi:hypothetical protein
VLDLKRLIVDSPSSILKVRISMAHCIETGNPLVLSGDSAPVAITLWTSPELTTSCSLVCADVTQRANSCETGYSHVLGALHDELDDPMTDDWKRLANGLDLVSYLLNTTPQLM